VESGQYTLAAREIDAYRQAFPDDAVTPVEQEANLALHRDTPAQALAVYDRAFRPLMPEPLLKSYFDLLEKQADCAIFWRAHGKARKRIRKTCCRWRGCITTTGARTTSRAACARWWNTSTARRTGAPMNWRAGDTVRAIAAMERRGALLVCAL